MTLDWNRFFLKMSAVPIYIFKLILQIVSDFIYYNFEKIDLYKSGLKNRSYYFKCKFCCAVNSSLKLKFCKLAQYLSFCSIKTEFKYKVVQFKYLVLPDKTIIRRIIEFIDGDVILFTPKFCDPRQYTLHDYCTRFENTTMNCNSFMLLYYMSRDLIQYPLRLFVKIDYISLLLLILLWKITVKTEIFTNNTPFRKFYINMME